MSQEHFNEVLDCFPFMKRAMESVAAERLHKIGRDPGLVSAARKVSLDPDCRQIADIVAALSAAETDSAQSTLTQVEDR